MHGHQACKVLPCILHDGPVVPFMKLLLSLLRFPLAEVLNVVRETFRREQFRSCS